MEDGPGDGSEKLSAKDGTVNGDTAEAVSSATLDLSKPTGIKQIIFVVSDLISDPIMPSCDFEIGDGTNYDKLFHRILDLHVRIVKSMADAWCWRLPIL